MATRKKKGRAGGSLGTFLLGFVCAVLLAAGGGWAYLHWGKDSRDSGHLLPERRPAVIQTPAVQGSLIPPSTPASAMHSPTASAPAAHVEHAIPKPPFEVSEDVFEAGAHVYRKQCAGCHGVPGRDGVAAQRTQPPASQLWKRAAGGSATGVNHQAPGQTFLQIKDGVQHSGMPSYEHILSDNQIWDVSLLLQNAGQPLPDPVMAILQRP